MEKKNKVKKDKSIKKEIDKPKHLITFIVGKGKGVKFNGIWMNKSTIDAWVHMVEVNIDKLESAEDKVSLGMKRYYERARKEIELGKELIELL